MARIPRPGEQGDSSDLVPPGEHLAIVVAVSTEPSKNTGGDMITLTLELDNKVGGRRKTLRSWCPFSNSMRLQELYNSFPNAIDDEGFLDSDRLQGERCYIEVIHELYNKKMTDKVDIISIYEGDTPGYRSATVRLNQDSSFSEVNRGPAIKDEDLDDCPF